MGSRCMPADGVMGDLYDLGNVTELASLHDMDWIDLRMEQRAKPQHRSKEQSHSTGTKSKGTGWE